MDLSSLGWIVAVVSWFWRKAMSLAADLATAVGFDWGARMALKLRGERPKLLVGHRRLRGAYPFSHEFSNAQSVDAAWLAGRSTLAGNGIVGKHPGKLKRLILPDPTSESVAILGETYHVNLVDEIRRGAESAARYGVEEIRYYPGFWGNEMTIGDAESAKGWAHVCQHLLGASDEDRVNLRVEKRSSPDLFRSLVESFDRMWEASSGTPGTAFEFFETRQEKNRARGNLPDELRDAKEVWLAFEKGNYFAALQKISDLPITRVVTLAAFDPVTMRLSKTETGDEYRWNTAISEVHRHAQEHDIDVVGVPGPVFNVVIADPDQRNGWARVYTYLPGLPAEEWPSVVLQREQHPTAFANVVRAYEHLWEHPERGAWPFHTEDSRSLIDTPEPDEDGSSGPTSGEEGS